MFCFSFYCSHASKINVCRCSPNHLPLCWLSGHNQHCFLTGMSLGLFLAGYSGRE